MSSKLTFLKIHLITFSLIADLTPKFYTRLKVVIDSFGAQGRAKLCISQTSLNNEMIKKLMQAFEFHNLERRCQASSGHEAEV